MNLGKRRKNPVVICPKQILKDWNDEGATVYSFEQFKKASNLKELPSNPTAIIVDEADMMASPLFIAKQRSQRTEALYEYIMQNPQAHVLLLTATPVRSTPWNMHTLLVLSRIKSGDTWKKYREMYFALQHMPYLPRPAWLPMMGWQKRMPTLIDKYTYTALMADLVDLPPESHDVIKLKAPNYEENVEWEPSKQFSEDHRLEQRGKDKEIKKLSKGYRKVVVVCRYREQIEELYKKLSKERETFVLDGRTRDVGQVIADAESSGECYLIVQAQVGAGFELPSFAVMIFASQSYGARDYVQMKGRIKRINALKPLKYFYLQAGKCDKMVYNAVKKGFDFVPSLYKASQEDEA
jgi:superfamily II DNA or RNA helicase